MASLFAASLVAAEKQSAEHADLVKDAHKKWENNKQVWQMKFPWLEAGTEGIGCSVCHCVGTQRKSDQDLTNPFANYSVVGASLQAANFKQHQTSKSHVAAQNAMTNGTGFGLGESPKKEEFAKVVSSVWRGDASCDFAKSYKFRMMEWCIAEARRDQLRDAILKAKSIALQQDVRDGQLLVGFSASLPDLSTVCGFLGQLNICADEFGLNSRALHKANVTVAFKFATSGLGAPQRSNCAKDGLGFINHEVVQALQEHVELLAADAASDESLCGKMLASFYKNIKCRQWDKAHACKRVLQRVWSADPYIAQTANNLVLGDGAIVQVVRHSKLFKERFDTAINDLTENACRRIKDLASAKHRFTSHSVPFRRSVLFFVPLIRVAQFILDNRARTTKEAQIARQWLLELDSERALTIAMMADISDEALQMNRFFDSSVWNIAETMATVQDFLTRVTWLIEKQGILETGCTQFMMETLKTPKAFFIDGMQRVIQKPSQEVVNKCMERLRCILQLIRKAVQSDFPDFETLQLFSIFDVRERHNPAKVAALARVLSLDAAKLNAEYLSVCPTAQFHFRNGSENSTMANAWKRAVEDLRGVECTVLTEALYRYMAWQPGTSAVERMFGKVHSSSHRWRGDLSEARIDDELQIQALSTKEGGSSANLVEWIQLKYGKLLEDAQNVWMKNFGPPRERSSKQLAPHSGYKRKTNDASEASFLKRRREAVREGAAGVHREEACRTAEMTVGVAGWNEKHEKEQKFLETKTKRRLCQALKEKAVSWDELDSEIATSCAAFLAHEADLVRQAFKTKAGCKLPQPVLPPITGKSIWLGGISETSQLRQALRKFSLRVVESSRNAALHLVQTLTQCSEANDLMWEIAVGGKTVLDEDCLKTGGQRGCCLTFKGACNTERVVHLTGRFCEHHEQIAACILFFCKQHMPTSKWFHESDRETFLALNAKYVAAKKPTRCMVFGTSDDSAIFRDVKLFKTAQSLADLSVLDRAHCLTGLQGKQWPSASAVGGA